VLQANLQASSCCCCCCCCCCWGITLLSWQHLHYQTLWWSLSRASCVTTSA